MATITMRDMRLYLLVRCRRFLQFAPAPSNEIDISHIDCIFTENLVDTIKQPGKKKNIIISKYYSISQGSRKYRYVGIEQEGWHI